MTSAYVREQKRYGFEELCDIFQRSREQTKGLIRRLEEFGILKTVLASQEQKDLSDLIEEDIQLADVDGSSEKYYYVFTFVGLIVVSGIVLKCYPKYILHNSSPKGELVKILKVLEKYNSKKQVIPMFTDRTARDSFQLLPILLFLIDDYYVNGIYQNSSSMIENNGTGEILWDKTIDMKYFVISGQKPYYVDLITRKHTFDDNSYFTRLHECVLTKISNELNEADLLDFFGIDEISLSEEDLDDFGDKDNILYRIENELSTQFNTRKQLVLKSIYAYIANGSSINDTDAISILGTNSFNLIWESVCAEILDNQLNKRICDIPCPQGFGLQEDMNMRLIDMIEKPFWSVTNNFANDTLIPDLICVKDDCFCIFDAKYYNAILEPDKPPKSQPGIESITKQYLYQLAYKEFNEKHGFHIVKNCFLMPTELEDVVDKGTVSLPFLRSMGLEDIEIRLLPAMTAFDFYLTGKKLDISELKI